MIAFATSDFYSYKYLCGRPPGLDDPCFDYYAKQATMKIKQYTFDNIDESKELPEEVRMCCCEIAEILYKEEKRQEQSGGLSSESVGGWSKSYESGEQAEKQFEKKIKNCIYSWLSNTGLLYRGVVKK